MLRNKMRTILLLGGNYEEVKMETEKAIITFMTSMPKVIVQQEEEFQIEETTEVEQAVQSRGVSPIIAVSPTIEVSSPIAVSPS